MEYQNMEDGKYLNLIEQESTPFITNTQTPKGWKMFSMELYNRPKTFKEWRRVIWGYDIFVQGIPFLKILLLANILMWVGLWMTK